MSISKLLVMLMNVLSHSSNSAPGVEADRCALSFDGGQCHSTQRKSLGDVMMPVLLIWVALGVLFSRLLGKCFLHVRRWGE